MPADGDVAEQFLSALRVDVRYAVSLAESARALIAAAERTAAQREAKARKARSTQKTAPGPLPG